MTDDNINITVTGASGAGKTSVAVLLRAALTTLGFKRIEILNPDGDTDAVSMPARIDEVIRRQPRIVIQEANKQQPLTWLKPSEMKPRHTYLVRLVNDSEDEFKRQFLLGTLGTSGDEVYDTASSAGRLPLSSVEAVAEIY